MCSGGRRNYKGVKLIYLECLTPSVADKSVLTLAVYSKCCWSILEGVQYRPAVCVQYSTYVYNMCTVQASCVCTLASVLALYCTVLYCTVLYCTGNVLQVYLWSSTEASCMCTLSTVQSSQASRNTGNWK